MSKIEPLMTLLVQWTIYLNAVGGAEMFLHRPLLGYLLVR